MKSFINAAKQLALQEQEKKSMPILKHIQLATKVGKRLAKKLNANVDIVEAGTYLMDCVLGQAIKKGRQSDHIQMCVDQAVELMSKFDLSEADKENIKHCVLEHHGAKKFYSIESEICCNADCYRFASMSGFSYAFRYLREMPFEDLIQLLKNKVDEKWNVLSLNICKKELTPQYSTISNFLKKLDTYSDTTRA